MPVGGLVVPRNSDESQSGHVTEVACQIERVSCQPMIGKSIGNQFSANHPTFTCVRDRERWIGYAKLPPGVNVCMMKE